MRLRVLGCYGGDFRGLFPAFLLDRRILLDAGTIGTVLPLEEQLRIESVLLTHHHIDHIVGLPFFADSIYGKLGKPVVIFSRKEVLRGLKKHLLNDEIWPDFTQLPSPEKATISYSEVQLEIEYSLGDGLSFVPIPNFHLDASCGYFLRKGNRAIAYSGDTSRCSAFSAAIRKQLAKNAGVELTALLVECSFPNRMEQFALETHHMTASLLKGMLDDLNSPRTKAYVFHMKPQFISEIESEIRELDGYSIELVKPDQEIIIE